MTRPVKALVFLKAAFVAVCIALALAGSHPPVQAQEEGKLSTVDAVQNNNIASINEHLRATDSRVESHSTQIETMTLQIAEAEGEAHAIFWVLGLLSSASLVLQITVRVKKQV